MKPNKRYLNEESKAENKMDQGNSVPQNKTIDNDSGPININPDREYDNIG